MSHLGGLAAKPEDLRENLLPCAKLRRPFQRAARQIRFKRDGKSKTNSSHAERMGIGPWAGRWSCDPGKINKQVRRLGQFRKH